jgi:hypothetical protein
MASAGGLKSSRIRPLDGLAFLISAISPHWPVAMRASSAGLKPRTGANRWPDLEFGPRQACLGARHFLALVGRDLVENGQAASGVRDLQRGLSAAASAAPLSMACRRRNALP